MADIANKEPETQNRLIALHQHELGCHCLGNWHDRENNSNIEPKILTVWLAARGHSMNIISKVFHKITKITNDHGKSFYDKHKALYTELNDFINKFFRNEKETPLH